MQRTPVFTKTCHHCLGQIIFKCLSFLKIPLKIKHLLGKWIDPFTMDAALFCVPISSDMYISTNHGQDLGHLELIYDFRPMIKKVL